MSNQSQPEDLRNIDFQARRRRPDPEYLEKPLDWFIGINCKLAFLAPDGRQEYMWVLCQGLALTKGEELRGQLDNDPQIAVEFECGDLIEFSRKEIIEVC